MANRYAVATGNWSAVGTWDGGTTLPGAGDIVRPNGFTVTIDQSITVGELINDAASPAVAGGWWIVAATVTVTADITCDTLATNDYVRLQTGVSETITIVGDITETSTVKGAARDTITITGTGTVSITGNITCSSIYYTRNLVYVSSAASLVVVGNVHGVGYNAGNLNYAIWVVSGGSVSITGNLTSGLNSYAVHLAAGATGTITGDITSNTGSHSTLLNYGTCTLTGTLIGGASLALSQNSTGVFNHIGNAQSSASGQPWNASGLYLIHASQELSHEHRVITSLAARTLYTGGTDIGNPAAADVRDATLFGPASEYTGSLNVPAPSLVALGVPTDATTGTYNANPTVLQQTTIATLASQTSFTLTAGSADDDAYNDKTVIVTDQTTAEQKAVGTISDYTGATKTVTLDADPAIFTMATGDLVSVVAGAGGGGFAQTGDSFAIINGASGSVATKAVVDAIPTTAMRGTDSAYTGTPPTAAAIADQVWDELQSAHVTVGSFGIIASEIAAIPTTAMRGTDSAALASVATEARLAELDAANIPADVDAVKVVTDKFVFTTANQVDSNMLSINSTATSAARLALSADVIIPATVDTVTNTHTPTTTEFQADDITEATADHYNGRIVIFTSGVLDGQATDITDYVAVGGIGQFTVTALTEAPSNNDTFIIV